MLCMKAHNPLFFFFFWNYLVSDFPFFLSRIRFVRESYIYTIHHSIHPSVHIPPLPSPPPSAGLEGGRAGRDSGAGRGPGRDGAACLSFSLTFDPHPLFFFVNSPFLFLFFCPVEGEEGRAEQRDYNSSVFPLYKIWMLRRGGWGGR